MAERRRRKGVGRHSGGGGGLFPAGYEAPGTADVPAEDDAGYDEAPYAGAPSAEPADDRGGAYAGEPYAEAPYAEAPHAEGPAADPRDADPRYADPRDGAPRYADPRYADPRDADPRYADPRYADPRYEDGAYPEGAYGEAESAEGAYAEGAYAEGVYSEGVYADGASGAGAYADDDYPDDDYPDDHYPDDEWDDEYHGAHPVRHRAALVGRRHPVVFGFLALVLVVLLVIGGGILWASHQINPGGHPGPKVTVTIPAGSTSGQIGSDLAKAGVIHGGSLFRYYVKIEGSGPLLSGTYSLPRNESYDQAISALEAGPVTVTDKLVIPEGFTLREIAARVAALPGMHLSAAKFLSLSSSGSVRSPLEPSGTNNLEGLVYAATYTIDRTDTESDILEEMVGDFDQEMTTLGLAQGAAKLHMTPYQVLTVASIVQGEAKYSDQFPDTASVIYNRLSTDQTLGTDSTLVYALRQKDPDLDLKTINYEQPSPYNTRLNKGLPPTPIDNPSLAAIKAAIDPPSTDLEYFVEINPDGRLGFASTNAGFQQLEDECNASQLGC